MLNIFPGANNGALNSQCGIEATMDRILADVAQYGRSHAERIAGIVSQDGDPQGLQQYADILEDWAQERFGDGGDDGEEDGGKKEPPEEPSAASRYIPTIAMIIGVLFIVLLIVSIAKK